MCIRDRFNGRAVCKYEYLLNENFDTFNTSRWKHTVKFASDPVILAFVHLHVFSMLNTLVFENQTKILNDDFSSLTQDYEFVTYSASPQVTYVKDGILYIKPMLLKDELVRKNQTLIGYVRVPKLEILGWGHKSFSILNHTICLYIYNTDALEPQNLKTV